MKRIRISISAGVAAALSFAGSLHAERNVISPEAAWTQSEAQNALYEMELRDEANANYLSHSQVRRIQAAQAVRHERAERELAAYQQFRFDQRLAMEEARAPRTYILNNGGGNSAEEIAPSSLRRSNGGVYRPVTHIRTGYEGMGPNVLNNSRTVISTSSAANRVRRYPARFWTKQAREHGANELRDETLTREAIEASAIGGSNGALRATPMSDRAGYVTNPETGNAIDVRGFRSGEIVRDPYSGETFRVP